MKMITFEGREYAIQNPNSDKLGIQNLKPLVQLAARIIEKVRQNAADGRYTWLEIVGTVWALTDLRPFLTGKRLEQIFSELVDLNSAEVSELLSAIGEELGVNLAEAELFFQERIMPLVSLTRTLVAVFR